MVKIFLVLYIFLFILVCFFPFLEIWVLLVNTENKKVIIFFQDLMLAFLIYWGSKTELHQRCTMFLFFMHNLHWISNHSGCFWKNWHYTVVLEMTTVFDSIHNIKLILQWGDLVFCPLFLSLFSELNKNWH